jgi:uncharacterized protein (TIGR03067 family)
MKRGVCFVLVLAIPLPLGADDAEKSHKELTALEGKWKSVSMEVGTLKLSKEQAQAFTLNVSANGKSALKVLHGEMQAAIIKVNPNKSPKTIDFHFDGGGLKGKKHFGIYKLNGDKLTMCLNLEGSEKYRPKDFNPREGTVFVYERQRDEKQP